MQRDALTHIAQQLACDPPPSPAALNKLIRTAFVDATAHTYRQQEARSLFQTLLQAIQTRTTLHDHDKQHLGRRRNQQQALLWTHTLEFLVHEAQDTFIRALYRIRPSKNAQQYYRQNSNEILQDFNEILHVLEENERIADPKIGIGAHTRVNFKKFVDWYLKEMGDMSQVSHLEDNSDNINMSELLAIAVKLWRDQELRKLATAWNNTATDEKQESKSESLSKLSRLDQIGNEFEVFMRKITEEELQSNLDKIQRQIGTYIDLFISNFWKLVASNEDELKIVKCVQDMYNNVSNGTWAHVCNSISGKGRLKFFMNSFLSKFNQEQFLLDVVSLTRLSLIPSKDCSPEDSIVALKQCIAAVERYFLEVNQECRLITKALLESIQKNFESIQITIEKLREKVSSEELGRVEASFADIIQKCLSNTSMTKTNRKVIRDNFSSVLPSFDAQFSENALDIMYQGILETKDASGMSFLNFIADVRELLLTAPAEIEEWHTFAASCFDRIDDVSKMSLSQLNRNSDLSFISNIVDEICELERRLRILHFSCSKELKNLKRMLCYFRFLQFHENEVLLLFVQLMQFIDNVAENISCITYFDLHEVYIGIDKLLLASLEFILEGKDLAYLLHVRSSVTNIIESVCGILSQTSFKADNCEDILVFGISAATESILRSYSMLRWHSTSIKAQVERELAISDHYLAEQKIDSTQDDPLVQRRKDRDGVQQEQCSSKVSHLFTSIMNSLSEERIQYQDVLKGLVELNEVIKHSFGNVVMYEVCYHYIEDSIRKALDVYPSSRQKILLSKTLCVLDMYADYLVQSIESTEIAQKLEDVKLLVDGCTSEIMENATLEVDEGKLDYDVISQEIMAFYKKIRSTEVTVDRRRKALNLVRDTVKKVDKSATVEIYGSCASGLATEKSDLDLGVFGNANYSDRGAIIDLLIQVRKKLWKTGHIKSIQSILTARVPILKIIFNERLDEMECDLSVGNPVSQYKSALLQVYTSLDHRVAQLILSVKHWAKTRGIGDAAAGHMSSFAHTMCTLQHLQMVSPSVVPCVQTDEDDMTVSAVKCKDNWLRNTISFKPENVMGIGEIFFLYIRQMALNFQPNIHCISVRQGSFKVLGPRGRRSQFRPDHLVNLCIEDPLDSTDNIGRSVTVPKLIEVLLQIYETYEELCSGFGFRHICRTEQKSNKPKQDRQNNDRQNSKRNRDKRGGQKGRKSRPYRRKDKDRGHGKSHNETWTGRG